MRKPKRSELANIQIEYWKESDDPSFPEIRYLVDGWVDKEGAEIIAIYKFHNDSWSVVESSALSGDDLDKMTECLLTEYEDTVESESSGFEELDDFGLLDFYGED